MTPKIIGLTGGIGSGKTTIATHIQKLGVPVYIADIEAKKIMDSAGIVSKITAVFGEDLLENGKINKQKLSEIVFKQPEKLQILNAIIHPEVAQHFKKWVKKNKKHPILIKEAAILFESGSYKDCTQIILVTAPKEIRIQRVMQRDGLSRADIEKRMNNQWSEEKKQELSDFVIVNQDLQEAQQAAENIIYLLRNK